jgi:hypothetical protein
MIVVPSSMALYSLKLMQGSFVFALDADIVSLAWIMNLALDTGKVLSILTIKIIAHF